MCDTAVYRRAASVVAADVTIHLGATVINCSLAGAAATIGAGAVLEHCVLHTDSWHIGDGALVSGLRQWGHATSDLYVPRGMVLQVRM
jgi:ADP-glucose pyrophosphorylase